METFGIHLYKEYFNFAAAHFLIFEDGSREELHGHNYRAEISIEGFLDENNDIFIDFLHVKPIVRAVCDAIDHRTLLPKFNPVLNIEHTERYVKISHKSGDEWVLPSRDVVILPVSNTSAERLAQYLCLQTLEHLEKKYPEVVISKVEFIVEESLGQAAVYHNNFTDKKALKNLRFSDGTFGEEA